MEIFTRGMLSMTSDFLYSAVLGMALLFVGLWVVILGLGFVLSSGNEGLFPESADSTAVPRFHSN